MAPLIFVVLFLVMSGYSLGATFPIAKTGCDDHCGNISIPFPFGTKEGCYLDDGFFISCLSSSNGTIFDPPQPFLGNSNIEVINISPEGQLRLLQFVGYDCYDKNVSSKENSPSITIPVPFIFNTTANKFTIVGCDSYSIVNGRSTGSRPHVYTTGCIAMCYSEEDVEDGSCSGIGCCQTSIPRGAWQINVTLASYYNHSRVASFNPCSFAFVVETNAFQFYAANLTNLESVVSLPVLVDWVVAYENCSVAQKNSSSYACGQNSECNDEVGAQGYRCKCKEGYEGNPYISNGCQDINECGDHSMSSCATFSICDNKVGNYSCDCIAGYHGDGRKVNGCIADEIIAKPSKKNYWPIYAGVGVSTGTMAVLACTICLYFELTRRKTNRLREQFFKKNGGLILEQKLSGQGGGGTTYNTRIFTIEELKKATNDFDENQILGTGGFGTVFKGELTDKTVVAVKKSRGVDQNQVEQFINEVIVLSQINNRNVVKLLGCCLETEAPLLVYEFINNGTLYDNLHSILKASKLNWSIRLRIASEVAGVLSYLHSIASPPIIHRDIKSANILLDHNYTAKVADFGTSRLIEMDENQVATMVQGTHGYLDPEYMQTGLLTEKSDVYSFGMVLIELLTGKRVLAHDKPEAERFLSHQFLVALKEGKLVHILDTNICCIENIEQLKELANIAKTCLSVNGEDRPSMREIERDIGALAVIARQLVAHTLEIHDLTEDDALLGLQSNIRSDSIGDAPTSSDLYPVSHTTIQQMLPMGGGR